MKHYEEKKKIRFYIHNGLAGDQHELLIGVNYKGYIIVRYHLNYIV
jgi:hypothetical protein